MCFKVDVSDWGVEVYIGCRQSCGFRQSHSGVGNERDEVSFAIIDGSAFCVAGLSKSAAFRDLGSSVRVR